MSGSIQPGGRWRSANATLDNIIRSAYPGHSLQEQLVGGPDWVRSTEFDILASAAKPDATRDELNAMARALLAERFKLVLHTQIRGLQGYALVLARADGRLGQKVKAPAFDCVRFRDARLRGEATPPETVRGCATMVTNAGATTKLVAGGVTLSGLANVLRSSVSAPIVDETGRSEAFDITLDFAADLAQPQSGDLPSLFTALQEQLALRLERRTVPTEILVIDRVELPTPD